MNKPTAMDIEALVLDFDIYPRHKVDSLQVKNIINAIEAGETMPPIIVDAKTKRIVDGFHRYKAYKQCELKEVMVELREYKDEKTLLLDSFSLNARHGQRLTPFDRSRCILLAKKYKISSDLVASALCVTKKIVFEIVRGKTATVDSSGKSIPIKRSISHMAGESMTDTQVAAIPRLGGNSQTFYANQLIRLIESDLLDIENEELLARLSRLYELLGSLPIEK